MDYELDRKNLPDPDLLERVLDRGIVVEDSLRGLDSAVDKKPPNKLATERLLCVEDDLDSCKALAEFLRSLGYEVITASRVAEGLRLTQEYLFDLIILDNWFKESSGVELCRKIREFDSEIPIIFYSAAGYETDVRNGLDAGAQAYIVKPDFDEFLRTITDILSSKNKKHPR